jgi:hypothetical protein
MEPPTEYEEKMNRAFTDMTDNTNRIRDIDGWNLVLQNMYRLKLMSVED